MLALLAAGCSGDDDSATPSAGSQTTTSSATSPTAGTSGTTSTPTTGTTGTTPTTGTTGTTGATGSGSFPVAYQSLSGEATRLSVNQAFVDALRTVRVNLEPVAPATSTESGGTSTFSFPVTGGRATVEPGATEPFTGTVEHGGGLRLSFANRSVTIEDLVLDADDDGVSAVVSGQRVPLLALDDQQAQFEAQGDTVSVTYDAVSLLPEAANRLSGQLGLPLPQVELGQLESTLSGSS